MIARAEALKVRLLAHPQVTETSIALWAPFRPALTASLEDDSYFHTRGASCSSTTGATSSTTTSGAAGSRAGWRGPVILREQLRDRHRDVISVTVNRWDGQETAQRIELHVGRDLQFIRINGTVVGAA